MLKEIWGGWDGKGRDPREDELVNWGAAPSPAFSDRNLQLHLVPGRCGVGVGGVMRSTSTAVCLSAREEELPGACCTIQINPIQRANEG